MTTTTEAVLASDFQATWEEREVNRQRFNGSKHVDECFLCGRGLTEKAVENGRFIHLTTSGFLVPQDAEGVDSQGAFPVGSECAKRLPKPLAFRI